MTPIAVDPAPTEPAEITVEDVIDAPADVVDATVEIAIPASTAAPTVPPPAPVSAPPLLQEPVEVAAPVSQGPATRVHSHRLVTASPKLRLTPSQAVRLASDGRDVLTRARPRAT
ncbi:MAG: hypothetical protein KG028_06050 [Actinobacteria bacterium]|jgi:hypothetical protein|nr:hypothetical protein [Actinomycetota bacterium]